MCPLTLSCDHSELSCDQVCSAGSRLIVQENIAERMVSKIKERLTHFRVGDSLDKVRHQ